MRQQSLRKVDKRTPGGKTVTQLVKRNPKQASCAKCGAKLPGIPRVRATMMKYLPKTKKRPERPFGGQLCTKCTRAEIEKRTPTLE